MNACVGYALGASALFGLSTPLAKLLLGSVSPVLLGGLLYLGSGVGLIVARLWRDKGWQITGLQPDEWPWLAGAIISGGVLGPVALMLGLQRTAGSTASLLLNLEAVLTAVLAWVAFKENADRRVVVGMLAIVAGSVILSWPTDAATDRGLGWGAGLIVLACLCWAIDNNLTRKVSASDALFIAGSKGLVAGGVNVSIAIAFGDAWPALSTTTRASPFVKQKLNCGPRSGPYFHLSSKPTSRAQIGRRGGQQGADWPNYKRSFVWRVHRHGP